MGAMFGKYGSALIISPTKMAASLAARSFTALTRSRASARSATLGLPISPMKTASRG